MPEPRLISSYVAVLAAELPASIVEELADGLAETHRSYLRQGLAPDLAAQSAVAEFGEPELIVACFARVNPARRAARRLLGIGPAVGACWLAALVTSRAWAVPLPARMLAGLALAAVIGLLVTSALGRRYRLAARTGAAGFLGVIALDASLIASVAFAGVPLTWVLVVAMVASAARLSYAARALRPALAG
ncbi:MAG TPA: hypothetical protein VFJ07_07330 [Streptosporangiaceae bacterium]|nr:hypothetical protein [Streptosporangiaceae bacterium]